MADRQPNYDTVRRRYELDITQHEDSIASGRARKEAIARQKELNLRRAELQNLDLDDESDRIDENERSLTGRIAEIRNELKLMVKTGGSDG